MQLNLGVIPYDDLADELPRRIRRELLEFLRGIEPLSIKPPSVAGDSPQAPATVTTGYPQHRTARVRANEFLSFFLRYGRAPWWYRGTATHRTRLDDHIRMVPKDVARIVRQHGREEDVRRRIVWQYEEDGTKKIVVALEPDNHDRIFQFADNLFDIQSSGQLVQDSPKSFRREAWLWILTHLLVERGALFNTVEFDRSILRQMADHYQFDYQTLLDQFTSAAAELNAKGHDVPRFIEALQVIRAEENTACNPQPAADYWPLFASRLNSQPDNCQQQPLSVDLREARRRDVKRTAAILRDHFANAPQSDCDYVIAQLKETDLVALLELLTPLNQAVILSFIQAVAAAAYDVNEALIWRAVLVHLAGSSSAVSTLHGLIQALLTKIAHDASIQRDDVQRSMINYVSAVARLGQHSELLRILINLSDQDVRADKGQPDRWQDYQDAVEHFLSTGTRKESAPAGGVCLSLTDMLGQLLLQQPRRCAECIRRGSAKTDIATGVHRLMSITAEYDLPVLLPTLRPDSAALLGELANIFHANSADMPAAIDPYHHLYPAIVAVLLQHRNTPLDAEALLNYAADRLIAMFHVPQTTLQSIILAYSSRYKTKNAAVRTLHQWAVLDGAADSAQSDIDAFNPQRLDALPVKQQLASLIHHIRRLNKTVLPKPILESFRRLSRLHGTRLLRYLSDQHDGKALLKTLFASADPQMLEEWAANLSPELGYKYMQLFNQSDVDAFNPQRLDALPVEQQLAHLIHQIRRPDKTALPKSVFESFQRLSRRHEMRLLLHLSDQYDGKALLKTLVGRADPQSLGNWVGNLSSGPGDKSMPLFDQWMRALRRSGLLSGSSQSSVEEMTNLFWLVILEQTAAGNAIEHALSILPGILSMQLRLSSVTVIRHLSQTQQ